MDNIVSSRGADVDIEIPFTQGYTVFNAEQTACPSIFMQPCRRSTMHRPAGDRRGFFFARAKASIQQGGSSAFYASATPPEGPQGREGDHHSATTLTPR
jgi:antirestriction protein ArdC